VRLQARSSLLGYRFAGYNPGQADAQVVVQPTTQEPPLAEPPSGAAPVSQNEPVVEVHPLPGAVKTAPPRLGPPVVTTSQQAAPAPPRTLPPGMAPAAPMPKTPAEAPPMPAPPMSARPF
jgi:hypothetical protein